MQHIWQQSYDTGVTWDAPIKAYPVYQLLDEAGVQHAQKSAMLFMGKKYTWAEFAGIATKIAAWFQANGFVKGDRIGVMLPNTPFYPVFYHGVLKAGGVVVNINPLYAPEELSFIVQDSGLKALVTLDLCALFDKADVLVSNGILAKIIVCRFTDVLPFPKNLLFPVLKFKAIASKAHSGVHTLLDDVLGHDHPWQDPHINPHTDTAVLQYTGGTTGKPKAAMLSHANVTANVEQCAYWVQNYAHKDRQDRMMAVIPFFHAFSMTAVLNLSTKFGFELVTVPKFDPLDCLKLVDKLKPTFFPAVPAIYNALLNHANCARYNLTSLQACISGGAPLPVDMKARFETVTGARVVEGYGLSEASPVVCVNPLKGVNKPGSIGVPLPGTSVRLISPETGAEVAVGEKGELCVQGPQVMQGYWNKADETAHVLKAGLLHTGDIAVMDADGYVFIVDRIKDMIITNGYKVYPRHVEEAIYAHDAVEECIVAGLPDPERGEMVKAWVKLKESHALSETDLRVYLESKLSPLERPKLIEFRTAPLPKTLIGKLSRKDIVKEELGKR